MKQKISLEKQINSFKNIITQLSQEKAILSNQLLMKTIHENELMLRIQEMEKRMDRRQCLTRLLTLQAKLLTQYRAASPRLFGAGRPVRHHERTEHGR